MGSGHGGKVASMETLQTLLVLWDAVPLFFQIALKIMLILVPLMVAVAYYTYAERKVIAYMHVRIGPNRVGPRGWLQPIADALKLMFKEMLIPTNADRYLFIVAPILSLAPAIGAWAVIPFTGTLILANVDASLLFVLALTSLGIYGVVNKSLKDICFVIQARLNSTRVPRKMTKPFSDTTLMGLGIQKVLDSKIIPNDNFYCSVYERELVELCEKYDVNVFHRSEKSANEEHTVSGMYEWSDKLPYKYVVLINACAPLLKTETIDAFVAKYMHSDSDGLFGVIGKKQYYWNGEAEYGLLLFNFFFS